MVLLESLYRHDIGLQYHHPLFQTYQMLIDILQRWISDLLRT